MPSWELQAWRLSLRQQASVAGDGSRMSRQCNSFVCEGLIAIGSNINMSGAAKQVRINSAPFLDLGPNCLLNRGRVSRPFSVRWSAGPRTFFDQNASSRTSSPGVYSPALLPMSCARRVLCLRCWTIDMRRRSVPRRYTLRWLEWN